MAYNDFETSADRGQPVHLFQFTYGVASDASPLYYAYTDAESEVVHGGITYSPLAIRLTTDLKTPGKAERNEARIEAPRTCEVAQLFVGFPSASVVGVKIREGHIPNPEDPAGWADGINFPVVWVGRVLEPSNDGAVTTFTCESAAASMRRLGLRRQYSWACSLVLYGPRCRASKSAATTVATVTVVNGNKLTIPGTWPQQNFLGGMIEWTGTHGPESRTIKAVNGSDFTLDGPARFLAAGASVSVVRGCPHTLAACESLHGNVQNYGGQPWIPTENPVGKNNHT